MDGIKGGAESAVGVGPFGGSRIIAADAFLALWTAQEVAVAMADPQLQFAALGAIAKGSVNLDSPRMGALLSLAQAKGALTAARAARVAAGLPPT